MQRSVHICKLIRFASDRGYVKFANLSLEQNQFTTAGIVLKTKTIQSSGRIFATLTDGRDQIQLILTSTLHGTFEKLKRGTRVSVTGIPLLSGRDEATAFPSLFVVKVHSSTLPAPVKFDEEGLKREAISHLMIGHLMALISEQLEENEFSRYEPRFITNSQVERENEPLMVRFPGRGTDLFLEISPLPQLLYAAVMTGVTKLYSPTRLFSRAFRDGFTSPDSPIVAAVEIEMGDDDKMSLEQIVRIIVSAFDKAQQRGLPFEPIPDDLIIVEGNDTTLPENAEAIRLKIKDIAPPLSTNYAFDIRKRIDVETSSGQVIIEGHEGYIAQEMPYNWLCIHVERLAIEDSWRIRQRYGPEISKQS